MAENSFRPQIEQAKADIRSIVEEIAKADKEIVSHFANIREKFNGTFKVTTPDGLNDMLTKLDSSMNKLNGTLEKQTTNTGKLSTAKRTLKNLSSEEVINQRALAKNADLQATATSKLVGAYDRLNAKRKIAKNDLRNLISSEKASTKEIQRAQREFDKYTAKINKANKATSNFSNNSLGGMVRGFRNLIGAFGIVGGATLIATLTKDIFKLVKEIESLNFALKTVTSTQEEFTRVQLFLEDISQRYGQSLITTTERYTKFLAAAKQSNVSLQATEQIFESVTKASGVLGLKTDELTGVYLALEQMLSKGKVTTEELRRQLGERLPGAFGIMAKAIGVNVAELDKMLRKGEILSAEALPKFARELEKAYGIENIRNVDTLVAAQNRLTNSWILFVKSVEGGEGKISSVFKSVFNFVTKAVDALTEFNKTFDEKMDEGSFSGTKTALEGITDESERMNTSIKEAAENLIPRYTKILEDWRKKLGDVNKEQSKSKLNNLINMATGEFDEQERTIKRAANQIGKYTKAIEVLKEVSKTGLLPGDNDSNGGGNTGNEDGGKKGDGIAKGSLAYFEKQIKLAEEAQQKLATNTEEYNKQGEAIKKAKEELEKFKALLGIRDAQSELKIPGRNTVNDSGEVERTPGLGFAEMDGVNSEFSFPDFEGLEEKLRGLQSELDRLREKSTITGEEMKDIFGEVTETFADLFDVDISKFDFLFDGLENSVSDWAELSKELIGSVLDASLNKYEIELQEAQRTQDLVLQNDLATQKQKRLAREKFDREERRIKTERAKQERRNNLIKIAVDTAVGVVKALASSPPPANFILAGIVGALGIAQAAVVASQPIPKFAEGHLAGTHQGKALINDANRSKYQEVVERKDGQVEIYKNRNQLIDMKRGDKVHRSEDSFLTHHDIEKDVLRMSMLGHSEQLGMLNSSDVLSGKIDDMKGSFDEAVDRMERLGKRPIHNHNHITIEKEYLEY